MIKWFRHKYFPWIMLLVVTATSFLSMVFLQQRYTTMLQAGAEYQMPVHLERTVDWIPSDYLVVKFLGTRTTWGDTVPPELGQLIYVSIGMQPNGMLYVKSASAHKPHDSEYMIAEVVRFGEGVVDFALPFNRVRLDLSKVDPVYYQPQFKDVLVATVKFSQGKGVVTGIYSKGIPLELAKSGEQHVDNTKVNPEEVVDTTKRTNKDSVVLQGSPASDSKHE